MEIKYLELFEDIVCEGEKCAENGFLRLCTASAQKKNLDPAPSDCLSRCLPEGGGRIPAGRYLFAQGFLPPDERPFSDDGDPAPAVRSAAADLWLEFLWRDAEPADRTVYVRLLTGGPQTAASVQGQKKSAGTVFQLFRRIL